MVIIRQSCSSVGRFLCRYQVLALTAGLFLHTLSPAIAAPDLSVSKSPDEVHRTAVTQARSGRYDVALEHLSALVESHPSRKVFLYDYISVLSWAGRDEEVLALSSRTDLKQAPDYVLYAMGKSARNRQQPGLAIKIYRIALKQNSDRQQARLGLALSLAEAGNPVEAEKQLETLLKRKPDSIELLEAMAYVKQLNRDHAGAIAIYDRLLANAPNHRAARRGRIINLVHLGASHEAARLIRHEAAALFSREELEQIATHQAAAVVRWGKLPVVDPADRHRDTDHAINLLQKQYENIEDKTTISALRNRFDLIAAYRNRHHMHKAVALYEQLRNQGITQFPPYVQAATGEAYLSLRQPERAVALLEQAVKEYPDNLDARYSLYYAYLESGRYEKSLAYIDALAASLPEKEWLPGGKEWQWSVDNLYAQTVASQARAYVGKLDLAEYRLRELVAQAPADPDARNALGGVALWRGWPRQALTEYRIVLAQDPENLGAHIGVARTMSARSDASAAEDILKPLLLHHGDNPHVQDLLRESTVRKMREIWLGVNGGSSSSLYQGSSELTMETYYYDKPWQPGVRPFIHLLHSEADFSAQTVTRNRLAAGLHYREQDVVLHGSISDGDGSPGVSLQGDWAFNDYWRGNLSLDSFSTQTPLQAALYGVEAWSMQMGTEYRFHENRSLGLSVQYMDFDDDNQRNTLSAFGRQRLINDMRYRLEGKLTAYHQTNSEDGAAYFNPSRQTSIELGLNNRWETWRRYEKSMYQRLLVNVGTSSQQGFDTELTWHVGYEHHWSFSRQLSLSYGISRARPVYDGNQEYATRGFMNLYARF